LAFFTALECFFSCLLSSSALTGGVFSVSFLCSFTSFTLSTFKEALLPLFSSFFDKLFS